jgi:hypothetical protein
LPATTISGIECLVVIAQLCLHDAVRIDFDDSGLGASARVSGRGFQAVIVLRTDNVFTPDWSKMNEACADDSCVAYFKHCQQKAPSTCDYYFSQPGDAQNTHVTITAKTPDALVQAEQDFGVLTRSGWVTREVSSSGFIVVSDKAAPPVCGHRSSLSCCWAVPK